MKFFNNLFKGNPRTNKSKEDQEHEQSKFMPKVKVAIEERFIINFIDNGGKFLYSENYNELNENLSLILKENNWVKEDLLITNNKIKSNYKLPNSIKVNQENSKCFVTDCENLIADDGSIFEELDELFVTELKPKGTDHFSSMAQDTSKKRHSEIQYMNGFISNEGRKIGIPTPANDAVTEIISEIDLQKSIPTPENIQRALEMI